MDAIEEWKKTGKLPNGELWQPSLGLRKKAESLDSKIYRNNKGILLTDYYTVVCSRANIPRRAAQVVLFYLRDQRMLEINWHSKHGPMLYPIGSLTSNF